MLSHTHRIATAGVVALFLLASCEAGEQLYSCAEDIACGEDCCFDNLFANHGLNDVVKIPGLEFSGYIQQSINTNSRNPRNPPSGAGNWPGAGWLYRSDEYMLNRIYMSMSHAPDRTTGEFDIGGAVDLLYGTDYQFLQSRGLETNSDFSNKWNSDNGAGLFGVGLMGLAMPQAYFEIANDNLSVKLGHFYHPLGFVRLDASGAAIGNSGTYSLFYSEFLPVTGGMAEYNLNDQLSVTAGIHRGSGNWEDNNNRLNGLFGLTWASCDGNTLFMYKGDIGAEDDAGVNDQYIQSIVFEQKFCDRWAYIFQSDYGWVNNGAPAGGDANFYSLINMVGCQVTEKLHGGIRYELFNDLDGTRVTPAPGRGIWNAAAAGGTYKICPNLWLRPEVRWDWFDAGRGVSSGAFGNGTESSQFVASFSVFMFF